MFRSFALASILLALAGLGAWSAYPRQPAPVQPRPDTLNERFAKQVKPFLDRYCISCHGPTRPKADLNLTHDQTVEAIAGNEKQWELVLERLHVGDMPPEDAKLKPRSEERAAVVAWLNDLRAREAERHAGDPGIVLARRLSNTEYDNTIRDLTGIDIRPTREFPVDPANQSGFDNSGESLAMSPALLKKYLAAARLVADHVVLKPDGFVFAPHPAVTETDRDKYCVKRIIDFYQHHTVDLADYFLAAAKFRDRARAGKSDAKLEQFAADAGLSAKYLAEVWTALTEAKEEAGPLAAIRKNWNDLPAAAPRARYEQLRDLVLRLRALLKPDVPKLSVSGMSPGSQPLVLWRNREFAIQHRSYSGSPTTDLKKLRAELKAAEAGLKAFLPTELEDKAAQGARADLERFCATFPDAFVITDRGPYFDPKAAGKGRPLTAGFHLMQGYFRDDAPLCELVLSEGERRELDALWFELDFITLAPRRQYKDFIFFERAEPPRFMFEAEFDFARSEDKDAVSEAKMTKLAEVYLAKARKKNASEAALAAIKTYFTTIAADIRRLEKARNDAEPSHRDALAKFAERAYRRPLSAAERADVLAFYKLLRDKDGLGHEDAMRDAIASILMSPHFCYRLDLSEPGRGVQPLSDHALASRLSYFLWSSMPDEELLARAAAGDLRKPEVLAAQARRMLRDPKVRGLATEFAGNWLDFRRFEEHNAVDRTRFPQFTNELRQAMFEEPVRYFTDIAKQNRPVLDLLFGQDTFVNRALAKHYGMPAPPKDEWIHVADATKYGRGGFLPMAVFQTRNAPGLRTSPVKRGYWVVSKVLGERIPPPPPTVPELPKDEAKLGDLTLAQLLARHRADKACAGCHNRFDAVGLVFEGFGPIGEGRDKDLSGKPVVTAATFPDGQERVGLDGLRAYLRGQRQDDFIDNLCRKLLSYALGRSLQLSDRSTLDAMKAKLKADGYAFGSLVESIVTSPQFRNRRGKDDGSR